MFLNSQSCRNKTETIQDLIIESDAEIIFITETWLKPSGDEVIINDLTPPGFHCTSIPRLSGPGGGLCIIARDNLNLQTTTITSYKSFECCECSLYASGQSTKFTCLYRPPPSKKNKLKVSDFVTEFETLMDSFITKNYRPIILGDFNLHHDNINDHNTNLVKSIITSHSFIQHVRTATHTKQHTLDWVITDENEKIHNLEVVNKCISDHYVITFSINIHKPKPKRLVMSRRTIIDHTKFEEDIVNSIPNILASNDVTHAYNTTVRQLYDHHAPAKQRTVSNRPSAPWLTQEVKHMKAGRRRWKENGVPRNWKSINKCLSNPT